ncbi:hypothetical protein [Burkholderia cepacia]|uniref:hypothetical protein n=1 Tax=Burkholderia cepacia TaxID=292 RepID=UPI0015765524|nr:hypothetical protein [Burkholderia cepacia]NTX23993.1 hypothetical protein [Burkholderia cepacia]
MVVKKRNVGDADQFAIIRAFTRVPRDASASFPDAVRGFGRAVVFVEEMRVAGMLVERGSDVNSGAAADAGVRRKSPVSAGGDRQRERGGGDAKKGA